MPPISARLASMRPRTPLGMVLPTTSWKATEPAPLAMQKIANRIMAAIAPASGGRVSTAIASRTRAVDCIVPAAAQTHLRRATPRIRPATASCGSNEPICRIGTNSVANTEGAPIAVISHGRTRPGLAICSASLVAAPLATLSR